MEPVQFDELPDVCLRKILGFLNLRDLVKFRAVSRQFKAYAEETPVELTVSDRRTSCGFWCEWYDTDRQIELGSSISPNVFDSVRSSLKLDQQLKFLHVHLQRTPADFDIEILNTFKQLVHLELGLRPRKNQLTLTLPNLKVLNVRFGLDKCSFVLKTPKLEILVCFLITNIRAEHPETIKRIECDCLDTNDLAPFENLQVLICHCGFDVLDGIRLSNWSALNELHIRSESLEEVAEDEPDFDEFRSSLLNLMRNRTKSKREELKLYLEEVLLVNPVEQLAGCFQHPYTIDGFTGKKTSKLTHGKDLWLLKNFRLLHRDSYPHLTLVRFGELMKLDVELSGDFFDRFPRIRVLVVSGPVDRDRFEWFLQHATAVRKLVLNNASLDQTFMDRLPQINDRLTSLTVNESCLIKNFDFILQLKQLREFETDRRLDSLDLPERAFRQLNELERFDFRAGREGAQIGRCSRIKNDYSLRFYAKKNEPSGSQTFRRDNLNWAELVTLYDQRRGASRRGRLQ